MSFATPPVTPTVPVPLPKPKKAKRTRRNWAVVALLLSVIAVGLEGIGHPCASLLFDPLPDVVTGVAYLWVIFFLWFNETVLADPMRLNPLLKRLGPKRAVGLALAGTPVALLIAGMATWMFGPFLLPAPLLVLTGVGTLLLVPALDFVLLVLQMDDLRRVWRTQAGTTWDKRVVVGCGLVTTAAVFSLIVRPVLIGQATAQALRTTGVKQQEAFVRLRFLGGESTMLDLTYRRNPPYWVCFGYQVREKGVYPWVGYGWEGIDGDRFGSTMANAKIARRTYFLMTGTPFESVPRPVSAFRQVSLGGGPDDVAVEETGGMVVGRPVPGLRLVQSQMVFSSDTQTETGEGTWTMTFRNTTHLPQEARADILLPPGATCYAVSLWINGVEKPAAFGSPQKVRAAYREIAVVQKRDPLLVTMPAPDHLLVQCFPVPAHADMKIKLGITTPLTWGFDTLFSLRDPFNEPCLYITFPAFGAVNFEVPNDFTQSVELWEGGGTGIFGLRGQEVFAPFRFPAHGQEANAHRNKTIVPNMVRTNNPSELPSSPVDVWFLLDASEGMNAGFNDKLQTALQYTLEDLPMGSRVFFGDTANTPPAPLERSTVSKSYQLPEHSRYVGGTDPAPALENTLRGAREAGNTAGHPSVVVFLHAASPAHVSDLAGVRRELHRGADDAHGPALVCVQLAPRAPDAVAMELGGFSNVYARRALPGRDVCTSAAEALRFAMRAAVASDDASKNNGLLPMSGRFPAVNGVAFVNPVPASSPATNAVSRLRQASLTTALWFRANQTASAGKAFDQRVAAGRPAAIARLVTPLSSAVVLETQAQYKKHGLDTKSAKKATKTPNTVLTPTRTPRCRNLPPVFCWSACFAWRWGPRRFCAASHKESMRAIGAATAFPDF